MEKFFSLLKNYIEKNKKEFNLITGKNITVKNGKLGKYVSPYGLFSIAFKITTNNNKTFLEIQIQNMNNIIFYLFPNFDNSNYYKKIVKMTNKYGGNCIMIGDFIVTVENYFDIVYDDFDRITIFLRGDEEKFDFLKFKKTLSIDSSKLLLEKFFNVLSAIEILALNKIDGKLFSVFDRKQLLKNQLKEEMFNLKNSETLFNILFSI